MIDIVASSDFHGWLPEITRSFDLMLLAGDLEPAHDHYYEYQREWYINTFVPWILSLPFKNDQSKVVFIAGNHSCYLAQEGGESPSIYQNIIKPCEGRLVYLHNQEYTWKHVNWDEIFEGKPVKATHIKIFGTPCCTIFGNWWNMLSDDTLKEKYSEIPEDCDIVLSHDAPYGLCDKCFGWYELGKTPYSIGNQPLREAIENKKPKYCLCGHLHSANHDWEKSENGTLVRQISYLNEQYIPTYNPYYFTWQE